MMTSIRSIGALTILSATTLLAACGTEATGPGPATLSQPISLSQLDSSFGSGATRIEIKFAASGLTAREVHVESDDAEEKITSQVTAIDPSAGTVTLALGGMTVSYSGSTRFRTPSRSRVTRAEWESAIASAIAAGGRPPIEARRNQPSTPQAPTDPAFAALDLRLKDRSDAAAIEVYVDSDNLVSVAAPPAVAILTVFNLPIEITASTQLSLGNPGGTVPSGPTEFQGAVTAADAAAGTITLAGGTVVTVSGVTFDATGDLYSVDAVVSAVAAGKAVRAEGLGTLVSAAAISAQSIKVEVD
jgi:hypothetical protein